MTRSAVVDRSADADAVARLRAGDRSAVGDLYDRWGDRVHSVCARVLDGDRHEAADTTHDTFLIAMDKIGQLRDPDRVGAWLLAIARHESTRRGRKRARERAVDPTDAAGPMANARHAVTDDVDHVERADVLEVAEGAIATLNAREAALVELHLVQGLVGKDLAAAAGIAHGQLHVAIARMKKRLSTAVAAHYVARTGSEDCDALATLLDGWTGRFDSVTRKRVSRHVRNCDVCTDRARRANPLAAAAVLPLLPVPAEARGRLIAATSPVANGAIGAELAPRAGRFRVDRHGFPMAVGRHRKIGWIGVAVLAVAVVGGLVVVGGRGDAGRDLSVDTAVTTTAGPSTHVPASSVAAPTSDTTSVATTAVPTTAVPTSVRAVPAPPSTTRPTTATPPPPPTPPADTTAPTLGILDSDTVVTETTSPCSDGADHVLDLAIEATDSSPISAQARLFDEYGNAASIALTPTESGFSGALGPFAATFGTGLESKVVGTLEVTVEDVAGNTSVRTRPIVIEINCQY